jgi:hypothetical protein
MNLCIVCGIRPGVKPLDVSEKFVGYPDLFAGSMVCEVCSRLFEDRKLRSSNWVLVNNEFKVLDKKELLSVLRDPPVGSLVYVKSSGKKYGFLRCMRFASTKSYVALCGEDEGLVIIARGRLAKLVDLAVEAYKKFRKKSVLLDGCSPSEWVYEDLCKRVEEAGGDPTWRIVVRAL